MLNEREIHNKAINTLRFLAVDGVQQANSGHPGLPMGAAVMAYTIWTRHLKHNPANPKWFDRDRFILSGGHGSMLLYALLHLTGYELPLEELKRFRQWKSLTPGHPEYGLTPGVETTTGPLGQGFANGVGMAIAEAHLAEVFNRPDSKIIDHFVYAIVTDGDLMEGVSSEAASLAGHLKLGKLIYLYDDNRITIEGSTDLAFTENRGARFSAYDWQVLHVEDGNDIEAIDTAILQAKQDPRPSLIICRTHIGYGLPTRQDTAKAHGEPPGNEELDLAKKNAGWPIEPKFYIPEDTLALFRKAIDTGKQAESEWNKQLMEYKNRYQESWAEFNRRITGKLQDNWQSDLPVFPEDTKGMATRASSGQVINALAKKVPELIGGSADLAPSTNTWIKESPDFQNVSHMGRNFHFGVRENGMGSIVNGLAYHGGVRPFGATFLVFSDYMRPAVRLSALSHLSSIWVYTHDSIGLGEDGPTHQPVEHLAALRAIPNMTVIRPADANEVVEAWKYAISNPQSACAIILTRQAVPTLNRKMYSPAAGLEKGAYILCDLGTGKPDIILMATGSEVSLILEAGDKLAQKGLNVRLISFPSWELFRKQSLEYQEAVLPIGIKARIAVEAGSAQGWREWVGDKGDTITIEGYGASAPAKEIFTNYGFTAENVVIKSEKLLKGLR
jgi:transketolase